MAHRSRLAGFIIDCRTDDLAAAAGFWAAALGDGRVRKPQGKYVKLDDQAGLHVEVQKVDHESRVHLDIESDDVDGGGGAAGAARGEAGGEGQDLGGDGGADRAAVLRDPGADGGLRGEGHDLGPTPGRTALDLPRGRRLQDQLRRGRADLSDRLRPLALLGGAGGGLPRRAAGHRPVLGERGPAAVPDLVDRGDRAQHPDRLLRAGVARHRRLHGGRRLRGLQADDGVPGSQHRLLRARRRGGDGAGRHGLRAAEPPDQGLLPGGGDAGRAVLPGLALQQGAVVLQRFRHRADQRAGEDGARLGGDRGGGDPGGEVPVLPGA